MLTIESKKSATILLINYNSNLILDLIQISKNVY